MVEESEHHPALYIIFTSNSAEDGGGIYAWYCTLNFSGNSIFRNNSAKDGGGVNTWYSSLNFIGNITFKENSAKKKNCGGIWAFYSTLNFTGNANFRNNSALFGGGICIFTSVLDIAENRGDNITGTCHECYHSFTLIFIENSATIPGGAVYTTDSTLNFDGYNIFNGNSAQYYGGGIYSENRTLHFGTSTTFSSNSGQLKGGGSMDLE